MSRLIVDITQLARWQGKLTGIPRVMSELSTRFALDNSELVVWDNDKHVFFRGEETRSNVANRPETINSEVSNKTARDILRTTAAKSRLARTVYRKIRKQKKIESIASDNSIQIEPIKDDVLVVLWGAWDDQFYIDKLVELESSGIKVIQFVYDMLPLVTPQFSGHATESLGNYAKTIYPLCELLISISRYTSQDVANWLKDNGLRIPEMREIRLGEDFNVSKSKTPTKPRSTSMSGVKGNDYILCVCTIEARKNHTLLYYTYKLAKQRKIKLPKLIIAGRQGWLSGDIYTLMTNDPETKDCFVFLQDANDSELSWLYSNCLFTIYPSFYEGWGLPVAESLAYGKPCIASNTSSMPEIAGNLIDYFSPTSTDECLTTITSLLDPARLKKAELKAKKYKPTTWDETYKSVKMYIKEQI